MAARDDTYRSQRWLDIVFALSCVAMLASMIWMFAKDYYREYRPVQERGREVEVALLRREAADLQEKNQSRASAAREKIAGVLESGYGQSLPSNLSDDDFLAEAKKLVPVLGNDAIKALQEKPIESSIGSLNLKDLKARLVALSVRLSAERAVRDSLVSQRDILQGEKAEASAIAASESAIKEKEREIGKLERTVEELKQNVRDREDEIALERKPFTDAVADLDRLNKDHERLIRQAKQKENTVRTWIRDLPILDAFNSPYKIRQDIPDGLLIDYNFKQVNRIDRCATCHMFIDRPGFDKQTLAALKEPPANGGGKDLQVQLKSSEIAVYGSHPRLDLFVGSNSPHPVEKFGCTICHSGQGGSATFNFAYHFPDRGKTDGATEEKYEDKRKRWESGKGNDGHKWHADLHPDYLWDHPMVPMRFVEASCLKCHPLVMDLIRTDGREEAPTLLKGYRLVRDLGCFGCHEIAGYKSGRPIGPDLRLEPYPPPSDLTPMERARLTADPNDPPGSMRKVGPGLRRIAEKTDPNWTARWIRSPRGFRPDTRMPHFFGLTNNNPDKLSDTQDADESQLSDAQRSFPDAEIQSMAFYLFKSSESFLARLSEVHRQGASEKAAEKQLRAAFQRLDQARRDDPQLVPRTNDPSLPPDKPIAELLSLSADMRNKLSKDQLAAVLNYFAERERLARAAEALDKRPYPPPELKDYKPNVENGAQVFQTKSCLACHTEDKAPKVYGHDGTLLDAANFGPNLMGLRQKLGYDKDPAMAAKWLYYWLVNPADYHPRTAMPTPQLTPQERADVIAWLLGDQGNVNPPADWKDVVVGPGNMQDLARGYLEKALPKSLTEGVLKNGITMKDVRYLGLRPDADERILINEANGSALSGWSQEDRLKYYVGRKSITRYGCYACHDVPGFETAKPIGTGLNDWGKKDTERLAFENITDYVTKHHHVQANGHWPSAIGQNGVAESREPTAESRYDPYFFDALEAHRRDGFLYQKLKEPRSYDYGKRKDRPWDDRLKMPQFQFAHPKKKQGETDEDFAARAAQEEREAVEAVMTFILGLVADPVPMKFVNQPRTDRLNEVKGTKILERHNCIGCHVVKPGNYEFAFDESMRKQLNRIWANTTNQEDLARDHVFPEHTAWRTHLPYPPGKGIARGLPRVVQVSDETGLPEVSLELWEALRFVDDKGQTVQVPAGMSPLMVPLDERLLQNGPTGGNFSEVLQRLLLRAEPTKTLTGDRGYLMSSVPPPLIREGQKVQPQWLYEFLRHPHAIRPAVQRNLQMPRFNLESEEIEALINYFIAVDRLQNPAAGLEYFAAKPPQQDPDYQAELRAEYRQRLQQIPAGGGAGTSTDYFENGWRILTNKDFCLKCHNIGRAPEFQIVQSSDPVEQAKNLNGPNLDQAAERLRPGYLERWISMPKRTLPYTLMTQYDPFFANVPDYPPTPALRPEERVRAVRDALLSWGFLTDPPPTAQKAGLRGDAHGRDAPKGGHH